MSATTYSMTKSEIAGDTHTGLDQLVSYIYADNGLAGANDAKDIAAGVDTLKAVGTGDVDIGLTGFGPQSGIEAIDATAAAGLTRLLGDGNANTLDFRNTTLTGNILIDGGYGNDAIYGGAGPDQIAGGLGNDKLNGGLGNDTYQFGRGMGAGIISDRDSTAGNADVLSIGAGVSESQLWFRHVGNSLEIRIVGSGDQATISDWYSGSANHVEQIRLADGSLPPDSHVDNLVNAMAGFAIPGADINSLPAYQDTLTGVITANWL